MKEAINMSTIKIAKIGEQDILMYLNKLNRHGIVAGATGNGKTITIKVMT